MTSIKGYSWELLKSSNGQAPNSKSQEYLQRIYTSAERLANLVNDMLDVSRIESGRIELKMEKVAVDKIISEVLADLSGRAAEKNIQLSFTPVGQPPFMATADSAKLIQVVTNLLGNAIKFTPNGGQVSIALKSGNGFVQVEIVDTGVGIDKDDLEKLFAKFVRAKTGDGLPGTGLGLYLSRKFIYLMGGTIWAKSDGPGHGSTFGFTLKSA